MEFGSIQIVVSVVLILGAAGVALLCDLMMRKNDQLREAMAELRVRRAEDHTVAVSPTHTVSRDAHPVAPPAPAPEKTTVEEAAPVAVAVEHPVAAFNGRAPGRTSGRSNGRDRDTAGNLVRKTNSAAKAAQDRTAELTSVSGRRTSPPAPAAEVLPRMNDMNSQEALSDWLNRRRAAARIAETSASVAAKPETQIAAPPAPAPMPIETAIDIEQKPVPVELPHEALPIETPTTFEPMVAEQPPASRNSLNQHAVEIDTALWESLISGIPLAPAPVATETIPTATVHETQFELIQGAASMSNQLAIPAGMHDQSFLTRLLEIKKPFTGLAVCIGINENDGSAPRSEDLMRSTSLFISGLLQDADFACQSGDDEFLMLCPGPQAAEAQHRLSQISERLWDFQLRGIGTFSILFSWGGVEANNELLSDAITSAADRMYQTKRSRKTVSMESANQRRKVV
jgi:hypothetical protein